MAFISDSETYKTLKKVSKYLSGEPGYVLRFDYTPKIRDSDIDNGSLIRYFSRKANEALGEIVEIEESLYNKLSQSSLYLTAKLPWRITGKIEDVYTTDTNGRSIRTYTGVVSANILAAMDADKIILGLLSKLPDPLQYYQKE